MPERSGPLDVKIAGLPFKILQTPGGRPGAPAKAEYVCKEVEQIRDHFGGGTEPNYGDYPTSVESVYFWDDWTNGLSPTRLQKIDKTYWAAQNVDARRAGQLILSPAGTQWSTLAGGSERVQKILDFGGINYLLLLQSIYKWNGAGFSSVVITPGTGNTAFTDLAVFNGNLIAGLKGTVNDPGLPAPTTAPVCGLAGGSTNLPAGSYQAGYTWTGAFGESVISPLPVATVLAAGNVYLGNNALAALTAPPGATGVNWYLVAAPGGVTLGRIAVTGGSGVVGGSTFTLSSATQGNGVAAPTPTVSYDNAGAGGVGRLIVTLNTWGTNYWNGRLVFAGGQINVVSSNTATTLTMLYPWTSIPANGSGYLIDKYGAYVWSPDGLTWNTMDPRLGSTDAGKIDKLAPVRFQLWKSVLPNKVYSCLDPTVAAGNAASWTSTASLIGDSTKNITSLSAYTTDLAIGKEDGLWSLDRNGNDFPILPELASVASPANAINMKQWRNGLGFPVRGGFFRYEGSKLESIGLDRYRHQTYTVIDQAPYTNELFVLVNTYGSSGSWVAVLLPDPWRWHLLITPSPVALPTAIGVSSNVVTGGPALLVAQAGGSGPLVFVYRLPQATDNPLDDAGYAYAASGSLVTTEIAPLPDQDKVWEVVRVKAVANNHNANAGLKVEYAVDGDIDLGNFTPLISANREQTQIVPGPGTAPVSPMMEFYFSQPVVSRAIQFRLTLSTTGSNDTPVLYHLVVHYKHTPAARKRWEVGLVCENGALGQASFRDDRSAETQVQQLLRLRNQPRIAQDFEDRLGNAWKVFVEKVDHELLEKLPGSAGDRWLCKVTLLEALTGPTPPVPGPVS